MSAGCGLLNFESFGRKTYYFDDDLVDNLAGTDIDGDPAFVHPPVGSCLFVYTSHRLISYLYEHLHIKDIEASFPVSVFLSNRIDAEVGAKLVMFCVHGGSRRPPIILKRELSLSGSGSIKDCLRTEWNDIYSEETPSIVDTNDSFFYRGGMLGFFKVVLGSCLYLSGSDPKISDLMRPNVEDLVQASLLSAESELEYHIVG